MILQDVGMLAVDSNRTKLYLHQMIEQQLLPSYVLYMEDSGAVTPEARVLAGDIRTEKTKKGTRKLNPDVSAATLLEEHGIPYQRIPTMDPNSDQVVKLVAACAQPILIYSGPGGAILGNRLLAAGKRFLHVHSGVLPYYRGSTTVYYSLLNEGNCGATVFVMDAHIDTGPVILKRTYPAPDDRTTIDLYYDPFIRARLLVEVLKEYARGGKLTYEAQDPAVGETYFIIHPVLKHIAILAHAGPKDE